jgi:cysteinyl-tRNA synthetase
MSKSLGNLVVVSDLLERMSPAAARLHLVRHRYRRDWEFRWDDLDRAGRLARALADLLGPGPVATSPRPERGRGAELAAEFAAALDDDLDTPRAVRHLEQAAREREAAAAGWMASILCGAAALG